MWSLNTCFIVLGVGIGVIMLMFLILCRGLIPIIVLKHIEDMCGQQVHQLFDFVCGTSTGSILAALLCLEKLSARECKGYYYDFSTEVFKMNNLMGLSQFFLNHAFYDTKLLEKTIRY